jgi:iron complex transport system ATP-binding protein
MRERGRREDGGDPLLGTEALSVSLGGRRLVDALGVAIERGQRWCVLGPNGSGKTTLLRVLAGLQAPDTGEVRLAGRRYADLGPATAARRRALLLQSRRFAFRMSVRDCVALGRHPHRSRFGLPHPSDASEVAAAMALMDLAAHAGRDVLELSGGEQQRTHLAMVLAQAPDVFLLDEPTTHLDLRHQAALFAHLRTLCERDGRAVVFSTHELSVAAAYATHALLLCGDGAVRWGPCDALLEPEVLTAVLGFPLSAVHGPAGRTFVPQW